MLPPSHDSDVSALVCGTEFRFAARRYLEFTRTELLQRSRAAVGRRATAQQPRIAWRRLGAAPGCSVA